ncbi:MAG TPA: class I SAM-dependent methyltransferase [Mycobacteriales bacterium]|nr:class I SAM-dependent methyltransferase [Mycobacteriales bacterium]
MGDIGELRQVFAESWDWTTGGEEWSDWFGGTPTLWYGTILPRLRQFILPASTILEIAPGFGRVTQFLRPACDHLVLVDLSPKCIEACKARFPDDPAIEFHVNDGTSLDMVADSSIDLAFSWDSLVHADREVVEAYVAELAKKLTDEGVAFIHHSNGGEHRLAHKIAVQVPERIRRPLVARGALLDVYAWRSTTITGEHVIAAARRAGLVCVSQELFTWEHGPFLTEAITVLARPGSKWDRPSAVRRNREFRRTVRTLAALQGDKQSS